MLRFELLAGRDLTYVTVIRGARGFVIYEYTHAGLACPGLQLDGAQVRYVLRADDVEPFRANETQIRRVLLGLELLRQVLWDDCVVSHRTLRARHLVYQRRIPCGNAIAAPMSGLSRMTRRRSGSRGRFRRKACLVDPHGDCQQITAAAPKKSRVAFPAGAGSRPGHRSGVTASVCLGAALSGVQSGLDTDAVALGNGRACGAKFRADRAHGPGAAGDGDRIRRWPLLQPSRRRLAGDPRAAG